MPLCHEIAQGCEWQGEHESCVSTISKDRAQQDSEMDGNKLVKETEFSKERAGN